MGEWKVSLSLRIPIALREQFDIVAKRESRTVGNLATTLLTWAGERLEQAGSTENLLHRNVPVPRDPNGNYKRNRKAAAI